MGSLRRMQYQPHSMETAETPEEVLDKCFRKSVCNQKVCKDRNLSFCVSKFVYLVVHVFSTCSNTKEKMRICFLAETIFFFFLPSLSGGCSDLFAMTGQPRS